MLLGLGFGILGWFVVFLQPTDEIRQALCFIVGTVFCVGGVIINEIEKRDKVV